MRLEEVSPARLGVRHFEVKSRKIKTLNPLNEEKVKMKGLDN